MGGIWNRVDGIGKVTGGALFADDVKVPGMLFGAVLMGRRPHARISRLGIDRAKAMDGVRAVLTPQDVRETFGVVVPHQPVITATARYWGDGIALVAAETEEIARAALGIIEVEWEDLPAVFDPEQAIEGPPIHEGGNVVVHHRVRKGDVEEGMRAADVVVERRFTTQRVEHAYIEPESVVAVPRDDGGMEVVGCIQNLFSTRRSLAGILGLDLSRVTVRQSAIGGSFGGKDEVMTQIAARAAVLARAAGRPVKMTYTREESMAQSYKRHPYVMDYRVGARADGTLIAIEARIVADAGAYASMTPFVTWRSAVQATGPYVCPNVRTDVWGVHTNNCYTGAMRGFGSPQVNFSIESIIDELAEKIGMDPIDLRLRICFEDGAETATGQVLGRVSLKEVIARAADLSGWREKRAAGRALGFACSYRGVSLGAEGVDATGAIVMVQPDGSVIVATGVTEMGQGSHTAMAIIAAEVLGIDVGRVRFAEVRTDRVPDSGPTVASRATCMFGQSVKKAAEQVKAVLGGGDYDEAVRAAYAEGRPLVGCGWHRSPETSWHDGRGDAYFTYVYGANVAEVDVDAETGKVDVARFTSVHDVGRAINPAGVRSQIYGGVAMGIGYGLLEEYRSDEGVPAQDNFDEYLLPTSMDMPDVRIDIVENEDEAGPFGAKSVGEPATEIAAPAIANAIHRATGRRVTDLPADLETIVLGRKLVREGPRGSRR